MNNMVKPLGLLGSSLGLGAVLSLTSVTSVQAFSLSRYIMDQDGNKMGHIAFSGDDTNVMNNIVDDFDKLNTFSFTDSTGTTFGLDFAQNAGLQLFRYNVSTGDLKATAYNLVTTTKTFREGFQFKTMAVNPLKPSGTNDATWGNEYASTQNLSQDASYVDGMILTENLGPTAADIPENSLTTALLIIGGVVVIGVRNKKNW